MELTTIIEQNVSRRSLLSSLAITSSGLLSGCVGTITDSGSASSGSDDERTLSRFWEYELRGRTGFPVIDDETVFVAGTTYDGGSMGRLFALDHTNGQRKWSLEDLGDEIPFAPHLDDSTLIVVNDAGTIIGIDVTDRERTWSTQVSTSPVTRPFTGRDSLYVGYEDGLRSVDPERGDVELVFEAEHGIDFAASADRAYVGSRRPTDGKTVVQTVDEGVSWTRSFDTTSVGGIAPTFDRVFVTAGRDLIALSPDSGETLWTTEVGPTVGEPVVADESVHVATGDGVGAYLRGSGDERWSTRIDGGATTSPAVSRNYLFVGVDDATRAFAADSGDEIGGANFKDGGITTKPTTTGHRVFVGNFEERSTGFDGRIYSFDVAPK